MLDSLIHRVRSNEAEEAMLGSMILKPEIIPEVLAIVTSSAMLSNEAAAAAFDRVVAMHAETGSIDLVRLKATMDAVDGDGGESFGFLVRATEQTPSGEAAEYYAKIVRDRWCVRELYYGAEEMLRGDKSGSEAVEQVEALVARVSDAVHTNVADGFLNTLRRVAGEVRDRKQPEVVSTCFSDIDEKLCGGFRPGDLVIIGGRPAMGKSALAQCMADQMSMGGGPHSVRAHGIPVGVFSLEMSEETWAERSLSSWSGVPLTKIRRRDVTPDELTQIDIAENTLCRARLEIEDGDLSIGSIRARARRMVRRLGVKCVFIDYLQLISDPAAAKHGKYQEVTSVSRQLKLLARTLRVPVVALAQLNRQVEGQTDKRPRLKDLRDSGALEQDADVALLLHREHYYTNDPDDEGVAELNIAKQRSGPTGTVRLAWDGERVCFRLAAHSGDRP